MSFSVTEIPLSGPLVITPSVHEDNRGYFLESYQRAKLKQAGLEDVFVQDNEALSSRGVLRGLHYQIHPEAQSKLVRVISGSVFDVIADIRPGSSTYGKWFGIELSDLNKKQLYVPAGFAHGYLVLEDRTIVNYKCNNYYSKAHEGGIRYDCPKINIEWPELNVPYQLSDKDLALPNFGEHLV